MSDYFSNACGGYGTQHNGPTEIFGHHIESSRNPHHSEVDFRSVGSVYMIYGDIHSGQSSFSELRTSRTYSKSADSKAGTTKRTDESYSPRDTFADTRSATTNNRQDDSDLDWYQTRSQRSSYSSIYTSSRLRPRMPPHAHTSKEKGSPPMYTNRGRYDKRRRSLSKRRSFDSSFRLRSRSRTRSKSRSRCEAEDDEYGTETDELPRGRRSSIRRPPQSRSRSRSHSNVHPSPQEISDCKSFVLLSQPKIQAETSNQFAKDNGNDRDGQRRSGYPQDVRLRDGIVSSTPTRSLSDCPLRFSSRSRSRSCSRPRPRSRTPTRLIEYPAHHTDSSAPDSSRAVVKWADTYPSNTGVLTSYGQNNRGLRRTDDSQMNHTSRLSNRGWVKSTTLNICYRSELWEQEQTWKEEVGIEMSWKSSRWHFMRNIRGAIECAKYIDKHQVRYV